MNKPTKILLFIILASIVSNSIAQMSFRQLSKDNGLPHNNVECILKDSEGFMWFGTRNGLCRFDGFEIKTYLNTNKPHSISGNRIQTIAEDKKGYIWVGTYQNGLNKLDKITNKFIQYGTDYKIGEQVYRIKVLSNGVVCVGSSNGLAIFDSLANKFKVYLPDGTPNCLNSHLVNDILETADGTIYIATWENNIQRFDIKTGKFYSINYNTQNYQFINFRKRLLEDKNGNIWISATRHGLCRYNPKTGNSKFFTKKSNELNTEVLNGDMLLTHDNKLWLATDGVGVNILDIKSETFEYLTNNYNDNTSICSNHVYTIFQDETQKIWIGTFDKGISYFDPNLNKFNQHIFPENTINFFANKSIISAYQDSEGFIWIGTDGDGLHQINSNREIKSFYFNEKSASGITSNAITALNEDKAGNILIGTFAGGLNVYNNKEQKFTHFFQNNTVHSENIWSIETASDNKVWLGLLGMGVDIYLPHLNTFKNVGPYSQEKIKIPYPNIMAIMEDSDGDIWFGSEGEGIYIYDKQLKKVMIFLQNQYNDLLRRLVIKAFYQDNAENIWIGTEGSGLFKYNKNTKSLKHFTTLDELPSMIVSGILQDKNNNMWFATYDGLALLNAGDSIFTTFNKSDGLTSNEFNAKAFILLKDGNILAGTTNGITIFNPQQLELNTKTPKVFFSKLLILNKEVQVGDSINGEVILNKDIVYTHQITINYDNRHFSVEFDVLNFSNPSKTKFRYKLEGVDKEWVTTGADRRFVSYWHLESGEYTLKVEATNGYGKWSEHTAELLIIIKPPFWKTWWFVGLMIVLFLGIIGLIYYNRLRFLKKTFAQQQAIREKKVAELEKENTESELEKLTFYTLNRNLVLINLKNKMLNLTVKARESVKSNLNIMIEEIDKEINDDKEWKFLEPRLDKFYNQFITRLREKHPDLSLSEIKVATYVRMNLTSKEIAEYMHKTTRAVENDRYRLRKKLNLDLNQSLKDYLLNL